MSNTDVNRRQRAQIPTLSALEGVDVALAARLASHKNHPLVRMLGAVGEIGDQPPLAALSCAVLAYGLVRRHPRVSRLGLSMLGSLVLATAVTGGLKRLVSRTRPHVLLDEGRYAVAWLGRSEGPSRSFPSGHTAGSVAVARAFARGYPEARQAAYAGASAVALVQLPRGAHYPLDVVAGALIGICVENGMDKIASYLVGGRPRP